MTLRVLVAPTEVRTDSILDHLQLERETHRPVLSEPFSPRRKLETRTALLQLVRVPCVYQGRVEDVSFISLDPRESIRVALDARGARVGPSGHRRRWAIGESAASPYQRADQC